MRIPVNHPGGRMASGAISVSWVRLWVSLSLGLLWGFAGCGGPSLERDQLAGSWKIDSIYRYYNGFEQRQLGTPQDPTYHYLPGDKVREQKGRDYQEYRLLWVEPDSLVYLAPDGGEIGRYQVLHLDAQQLVLKRAQPMIFPGAGQTRFEVRYFSRLPAP